MGNFSGRVSTSLTFRVPTTRSKVFNATLPHLSVARNHSRRLSREQNAPSRSRDNLGRPSREQNAAFRSRDNLGRHRQAPSCTNPISWPLWYTRQASPVPIISPGDFGTESLLLIQHRKEMAAESLLLATISYSEIRSYLVIFMLPTLSPHSPSCTIGTGTPSRLFS